MTGRRPVGRQCDARIPRYFIGCASDARQVSDLAEMLRHRLGTPGDGRRGGVVIFGVMDIRTSDFMLSFIAVLFLIGLAVLSVVMVLDAVYWDDPPPPDSHSHHHDHSHDHSHDHTPSAATTVP